MTTVDTRNSVETSRFEGAGGLSLVTKCWPPHGHSDETPRAVVALVHGISEHSGRYTALVEHFPTAGFALCAFDLRGHGQSEGRRGHIDEWQQYTDDVLAFLEHVRARYPGVPIFIYGHSLGALIVTQFVLTHPEGLSGMIVSGIPLRPTGVAKKPLVMLAKSLSRAWPTFSVSLGLDGSRLSRDPEMIRAYEQDKLVHHTATARWGTETLATIASVRTRLGEIDLPILILHGEADRVNSVEGSRDLFSGVSSQDKELHVYPGGTHEPHNDTIRDQVAHEVEEWIDKHLEPNAS
ncbi:MAG TPA: lysophospholipase [Gemmatimonadaceae bacterium]|jgi:alpha-beta hydrolase superfamily lysophospholipase|nr:lysophospholipase [Gemmatimonadaceae bacterium]